MNATLRYCNQVQPCQDTIRLPSVANDICSNLVKKITYILQYNNPTGLTKYYVDVEFFEFDMKNNKIQYFPQSFSVKFVPSSINLVKMIIFFVFLV